MNIRIFRQPTKDIQSDGKFYIDTLQVQDVRIIHHVSTIGITGIKSEETKLSDWRDVEIVEVDGYKTPNY